MVSSAGKKLVSNKVSDDIVQCHNQIKPEIYEKGSKIGINNDSNPKQATKTIKKEIYNEGKVSTI